MSRRRELRESTGRDDERGFTTVQYVATIGLSMLLLVMFANLLVDLYARGAIRDALDEAVRTSAPKGADPGVCEERADDVMSSLLRGPLADDIRITCRTEDGVVLAHAEGTLPSWLPLVMPAWDVSLDASMRAESEAES